MLSPEKRLSGGEREVSESQWDPLVGAGRRPSFRVEKLAPALWGGGSGAGRKK